MAKGFKAGAGGGAPLNFKVVGNPQPSNPKANTIWLNTDVPITGWYFAATQPENMAEGEVWFLTGSSSSVAFNSLKKNGIQVYPLSAKQYVGGAWVTKTAMVYQGGAWVELWDGALFDNGNQYTHITGGWWQNKDLGWTSSYAPNTGTVTISDSLNLNAPANNGAGVSTKKPIDLTQYNIIKVNISSNNHEVGLVVHDNLTGGLHDSQLADVNMSGTGEKSLDVSAITGSHYISLMNYNGGIPDWRRLCTTFLFRKIPTRPRCTKKL